MEPTRLDGFSEGRAHAGARRLQQPDRSSVHPFTHPHTPANTAWGGGEHKCWDKRLPRLPCTTNFSRGDFAATTVAKRDNQTRGFIFQANAELLGKRVFLTAVDGASLRWCCRFGPLTARLRRRSSVGEVWASGSTSEAGGSGGVEVFARDVMVSSGTVEHTQQS